MGDRGSKKAYTGPRTGIYLPTEFGCDRSIVVGWRSQNDRQTSRQTDKQNGMTIRLTLCDANVTQQTDRQTNMLMRILHTSPRVIKLNTKWCIFTKHQWDTLEAAKLTQCMHIHDWVCNKATMMTSLWRDILRNNRGMFTLTTCWLVTLTFHTKKTFVDTWVKWQMATRRVGCYVINSKTNYTLQCM